MKKILFSTFAIGITLFAANNNSQNYITQDALYIQECASCHMAFQTQFLPKRSWVKMMNTLDNHFGVDATFDSEDEKKVREYLLSNASDSNKNYGKMAKFAKSISTGSTLLAISEIPKFKKEHRGIPKKLIIQKEVKSLSNCMACHTDAQKGLYKERNIHIPNYGRWDD